MHRNLIIAIFIFFKIFAVAVQVQLDETSTEDKTIKDFGKANHLTIYHDYYNSTMYVDRAEVDEKFLHFGNYTPNSKLSQSHRNAVKVKLSFDFPFYGQPIRNIIVSTGGFIYTGDHVHSWLAASQYIAPLMANFDTSLSNDSFVRWNDNGTAFTVIWENVMLQDKPNMGKFTFSSTLHTNGDIGFAYFSVPVSIDNIQDDVHPVKVGLSDAYIMSRVVFSTRHATIYEYHRINLDFSAIKNWTIVYLTALPTCHGYKDCRSCINHDTSFKCVWCPAANRCSNGKDRKIEEWRQMACDRSSISDPDTCPEIGQKGNNATHIDNYNNNNSSSGDPSTVSILFNPIQLN